MPARTPDVSVVICAYTENRWAELVAAIDSLRAQTLPPLEIIVVVDHNPALLERATHELDGVIVVANSDTPGLGGARNSGLWKASGSVIAFLDDDAVATPVWLQELARGYEDERVLGVGGAIEPIWEGGRPRWLPAEFDWVVGCTYRGMPESPSSVRNLIGCNMSYRRDVLEALGGFRLGYGCDETELCIRARRRWPEQILLYVPAARVSHRVPASRARWKHFRTRCYFEGGSKAVVSWLLGSSEGLASERTYTLRTLPLGVAKGITETVVSRDPAGVTRAAAIVAGLAITTAGYVRGRTSVEEAARARGWSGGSPADEAARQSR